MFFRLKVSVDEAKMATSVHAGGHRSFEARRFGTQGGSECPGARDAREHLGRIRHLRHPFRADERRYFDHGKVSRRQTVHDLDLVRGRHERALVLQPVARSNLDDRHLSRHLRELHERRVSLHEIPFAAADGRHDAVTKRAER